MKIKYTFILIAVVVILVGFFLYKNLSNVGEPAETGALSLVKSEKDKSLIYQALFTDKRVEETKNKISNLLSKIGTESNDDYSTYIDMANYEMTLGNGEKVLYYLNKAISIDPANPLAYDNAGTMFERIGAYKSAENAFNLALKANPNFTYTYMQIIDLHKSYLNSPFEVTSKIFNEALLATNNDLQIMKDYASYLEYNKKLQEALSLWQKVYELEKDSNAREVIFEQIGLLSEKINKSMNIKW